MNKIKLKIDSTALGWSSCIRRFKNITIGDILPDNTISPEGGYSSLFHPAAIYGIAVHKYIDIMYKTNGHIPTARHYAELAFDVPKAVAKEKSAYLLDKRHLINTCYNLWENYISIEPSFELLQIPTKCFYCSGTGKLTTPRSLERSNIDYEIPCEKCNGTGIVQGPACEINFQLPFYSDDFIDIDLVGTIDGVGKFKAGIFSIRDIKVTSQWDKDKFLSQYELSRQLRIYVLACRMMAEREPNSILGKVGATKMGAFIDGVFIKPNANNNEYQRSSVMTFSNDELDKFQQTLLEFCSQLAWHVSKNYFPKQGILNGACNGNYGYRCEFWNVCKANDQVADIILKRDFKRRVFNPLNYGAD